MPFFMTLTKALHDGGVPLLIGTDIAVEGMVPAHLHRDLELLVEAGLTPYEALEAGTKNAGIAVTRMGRDGSFGTVEVGQRADLILVEGNPLESVSHTRNRIGVMVRGQWFTQAELNGLVDAYVATYRGRCPIGLKIKHGKLELSSLFNGPILYPSSRPSWSGPPA